MAKSKEFMYVDIMKDMIGLEFNGIDFGERLSNEAMQNRMFGIMHSKENNWAEGLYDLFLQQKSANPNLSAHDFLDVIRQASKNKGKDFDDQLRGIVNLETMGNVFDTFASVQNSGVIASFLCASKTKKVAADADLAYFYMDEVSRVISSDESLRANYASMDTTGRQTMVIACLKSLKAKGALDKPTPKQLKLAQTRWRAIYRKSADESLLCSMRDGGIDITDSSSIMYKFAASLGEVIKKDDARYMADRKAIRDMDEPLVDVERTPDRFTSDEMDDTPVLPRTENLVEYGKIFPRPTPQFKIQKMLQPFNTKAGLKFLDQIIEALQGVMVKNPWG